MKDVSARSPIFERQIDEVNSSSIKELYEVEEGWFVEFKSFPPDTQKIAKSISSFANAYGGILVFGIIEDQKTRRVKEIEGYTIEEADKLVTKIRQSVDSHLTPCPFYEIKTIKIDEPSINDKYIVWVRIPKGTAGPYLHSSGVIYTRKGDSASPISMNDLGLLERMWRDSETNRMKIKNRIEYLHSISLESIPRIEMFIIEDEHLVADDKDVSFQTFKKIALDDAAGTTNSIFDTAYPLDTSFIAQRMNSESSALGVMWDYDYRRSIHHINIPLPTQKWSGKSFNNNQVGSSEYDELKKYLIEKGIKREVFVVDMSYCLGIMSTILSRVYFLSKYKNFNKKLLLNAKVSGVKGALAVLNFTKFYEELYDRVVPFVFREPGFIFSLEDIKSWLELDFSAMKENESFSIDTANTMLIFMKLCNSIGITQYATLGFKDEENEHENEVENLSFDEFAKSIVSLLTKSYSYSAEINPNY